MAVKKTGFKTGKSNPYNKLVQELTECEFKLRMEKMKPMLTEFAANTLAEALNMWREHCNKHGVIDVYSIQRLG